MSGIKLLPCGRLLAAACLLASLPIQLSETTALAIEENELEPNDGARSTTISVAAALDRELDVALREGSAAIDRGGLDRSVVALSEMDHSGLPAAQKRELGKLWRKAADLAYRLEGPTEESLALYELALSLDPEDAQTRRIVLIERQRNAIRTARAAEATRFREAMERGEDPSEELLNVGVPGADASKGGQK